MTREDQVEKILDELEEEFAKANMPVNDKLTLFAKVSNAIYKCAEQELCTDIISREKESEWIPANQPPKASGRYIVTRHFFNDDFIEMASYATDLHKVDKYDFPKHKAGWYNYDSEYGHYEVDDVVAWMPIEPYNASPTGSEEVEE